MGLLNWVGDILGIEEPEMPDMSGQTQAAADATALQERMYDEGVERGQPWTDAGSAGINQLATMLGLGNDSTADGFGSLANGVDMSGWQQDPSYQFRMDEGLKALERSAAAKGGLYSPATSNALSNYAGNLASQEYGNIYERKSAEQSNLYNRLAGISGAGQTQSAQQTAAGQTMADNVGNINIGLADAVTAADLGTQASRQSMYNTLLSAMASGANAAATASDERVKENIKKVGSKNGHNLYHFNYIGDDKRYEGVMAQEVKKTNPEAVIEVDGIMYVKYGDIGLEMKEAV